MGHAQDLVNSVVEALHQLVGLSGIFLGRKGYGDPGGKTIWRGFTARYGFR